MTFVFYPLHRVRNCKVLFKEKLSVKNLESGAEALLSQFSTLSAQFINSILLPVSA